MLLQVDQTISFKSGVQAFTCPEGFAAPLAPVVQKSLKAASGVMVHGSKHFPGISVVEVVAPATNDAVHFDNRFDKRPFIAAFGLIPDFVFQCRYGLLGRHNIEILMISALQVSVITERESQKVQTLFLVHSDNSCFVTVYAESKVVFQCLFQPVRYAFTHESSHYNKVVGKPHHPRSGEVVRASFFFMKCPVKLIQVDVGKKGRYYPALWRSLFGTTDSAVFFDYDALKPLANQFEDTPVSYALLELYHQLIVRDAVKVAGKIRVIHFLPSELEVITYLVKGSVGTPFGAETMGTVEEVCLKDRFKYQKYGGLNDSVPHTGYAQRAQFTVRLGYVDAFHRERKVAFVYQALLDFIQIPAYSNSRSRMISRRRGLRLRGVQVVR